ncbi:MAG: hypothetical protein Q9209_005845 [Squamulea sp. 1 TL-2023]
MEEIPVDGTDVGGFVGIVGALGPRYVVGDEDEEVGVVTVTVPGHGAIWAFAGCHHNASVAHNNEKDRLPAIAVTEMSKETPANTWASPATTSLLQECVMAVKNERDTRLTNSKNHKQKQKHHVFWNERDLANFTKTLKDITIPKILPGQERSDGAGYEGC